MKIKTSKKRVLIGLCIFLVGILVGGIIGWQIDASRNTCHDNGIIGICCQMHPEPGTICPG